MAERTIKAVFATYTEVVQVPGGAKREVSRTATRGRKVDLSERDEARLDALGALEPKDGDAAEGAEGAIARALNPADNVPEGGAPATEPVSVSPPSLGAEPAGDLTKGDTGTGDVQPTGDAPGASAPEEAFDARGKSPDELAQWIKSKRPTAPQVVAAADNDPELAGALLEAEELATNGDPRKSVESQLQAIISGS